MLHEEHLPEPLPDEPLSTVAAWLAAAAAARTQPNPNAMVLATVGEDGAPSARVVLCKDVRPEPGFITFYTNYQSRKGRELATHPRAAVVLHWDALHRQVRLEGVVTQTSAADSDAYFNLRAWQSRIGAWASEQSAPLADRRTLEQAAENVARRFGAPSPIQQPDGPLPAGVQIPRPPHWGGFRLWIDAAELWVEGGARLHERARWQRTLTRHGEGYRASAWRATRLNP